MARSLLRWSLPVGTVLLIVALTFYGYGFLSGELEARPLTVLVAVATVAISLSTVLLGWSLRRDSHR